MKRYFVWKDANCNGINPEWVEITGKEFKKLTDEFPERRFIPSYDETDASSDVYRYEVTPEEYKDWNRERMSFYRHNEKLYADNTVVHFEDLVDEDDEEGLTWAEIIPDTSEEEAAAEEEFRNWKDEKIARLKELLKGIDEEEYDLLWNLIMNPKKEERMTEKAYAEKLGITQQAVHKRKKKILEKFRALLGC
ncbi:MAG: sigma-70 family RNA polymerase sigma factor [Clostridia bacterium]|nr:sigma-70 family RNA polymerase sigma factor [Clostridia bacterium]